MTTHQHYFKYTNKRVPLFKGGQVWGFEVNCSCGQLAFIQTDKIEEADKLLVGLNRSENDKT